MRVKRQDDDGERKGDGDSKNFDTGRVGQNLERDSGGRSWGDDAWLAVTDK
jgi:hypothetical protein